MPDVKRADLEALRNMVSQAHLIVSTEPLVKGGVERTRELLDTAERLADFLLSPDAGQVAARRNGTKRQHVG